MIHNNAINFKIASNDIFDGFRLGNYFLRNNFLLQVKQEGQQKPLRMRLRNKVIFTKRCN